MDTIIALTIYLISLTGGTVALVAAAALQSKGDYQKADKVETAGMLFTIIAFWSMLYLFLKIF